MPEYRESTQQGPQKLPDSGLSAKAGSKGNFANIDPEKLGSIFGTILQDAQDYRQRFEAVWLKCYSQYNGEADDRYKAEWQSRVHLPYAKQAADVWTAKVMNSLTQNEDFFDIRPNRRGDDEKANAAKRILKWQLFKSTGADPRGGDFRSELRVAVKNGGICGFGPLFYSYDERMVTRTVDSGIPVTGMVEGPDGDQLPVTMPQTHLIDQPMLERTLRFEAPFPNDIWLDPTGRNRFFIRHFRRSLPDLFALADPEMGPDGQPIRAALYDKALLSKVTAGLADQESEVNQSIIKRDTPYISKDVAVDVYEFHGDFYDPQTGAVLFKNSVMTFVNKRWMIRRPEANPNRSGQLPLIVICPTLGPFKVYGQGLLEPGVQLQDEIDRMANVILDKARLQVPVSEIFPSAFRNPADTMSAAAGNFKFFPAKLLIGKDPDKPMLRAVEGFAPPTETDMQILQWMVQTYQSITGVNEWATGQQQTQQRKTRQEVQLRAGATEQVFNDSATYIEEAALSPLLKNVYLLIIQYVSDYSDEILTKSFGDDQRGLAFVQALKQMSPEQRWQAMFLDAEFRVNAISLQISKQDRLTRTIGFLQAISQNPMLMGLVSNRTLLRDMLDLFGQDRDIVLSPADAILQSQEAAQLQAIFNPQQGPNQFNNQEQAQSNQQQGMEQAQGGGQPQ